MHMFSLKWSQIVCIPSQLLTLLGYNGRAFVIHQVTLQERINDRDESHTLSKGV